MCGRYYRRSDKQRIAEAFKVEKLPSGFELAPDYNIAPDTFQPVLVRLYPAGEGGLTASSRLSTDRSFSFQSVPDGDYMLEVAFPPTSDIVSIDAAAGVIHMRMTPSPYAAVIQEIEVTD